ncbi:myotubularin-related protein 10-B [Centruroides vittatus]|uniref:myotubularin-related protein 10-B n=1 Tax=Centruroides vittatus TaxID=120091 RepID=UPI00351015A7
MNSLRLKQRGQTFKTYVDLGLQQKEDPEFSSNLSSDEISCKRAMPNLLNGEMVIAQAENVLKFNIMSELKTGISGELICTTFKLSFVTPEDIPLNQHHQNIYLGENDICLINIDSIFHVSNGRKKKLLPGSIISSQIEIIEIHCKDFRIYTFSFKFSPSGCNKQIINALLYHAFVPKVQLLFLFDYLEHDKNATSSPIPFSLPIDWEAELTRCCCCSGWRVTQVNERYQMCESLPECFVVPANLFDADITKAAPHFIGHRVMMWSWGLPSGCALVRMAAADPAISETGQESSMIEAVSSAHPHQYPARVIDVESNCPFVREIQNSYLKLREICMPSTPHEFWEQDSHYLSALESSRWLHHISACLQTSLQIAITLCQNKHSVIIQERENRDLNCVISSLVQILLDPYCRTQQGFQHLIQKEWVALGHPFMERLHHINTTESEESPVFLLFLDCVWQLTQQCPSSFEFSETYLTTVWDSTHISIFDTFLFNSQKQLKEAYSQNGISGSHSVWNWSQQFLPHNIMFFRNPLYTLNSYQKITVAIPPLQTRPWSLNSARDARRNSQKRPLRISCHEMKSKISYMTQENLLEIDPYIKSLKLWSQCYLRWIPLAQIVGGGMPVLYLNNLKLSEEIRSLENIIKSLTSRTRQQQLLHQTHRRIASDDCVFTTEVNSCKLRQDSFVITSSFPFLPLGPWTSQNLHAVPSSSCLQVVSFSSDEELLDE